MIKGMLSAISKLCLALPLLALAACSGDDEGASAPALPTETVQLYIAVPAAADTRVGDPGEPTGEGADWDELAVMLEYVRNSDDISMPAQRRMAKIITKEEFDRLPAVSGNANVRRLALDVQPGDVHIYGVTYSSGIAVTDGVKDLGDVIDGWANSTDAVASLTIPNSYAQDDANRVGKFLSVATGFYADASGDLGTYEIRQGTEGEVGQATPTMTLTRLAAKIDIQWDAADAYPKYTNVVVTGFTFHGETNAGGSDIQSDPGRGRLFPTLYAGNEILGGQSTFLNTTEISQRNGRVYHYVFPDGVGTPRVTFSISAKGVDSKPYTFTFPSPLRKATWYKVNTTIRGLNGQTTFELENMESGK